jgi:hypothetical protein
MTETHDKEKMEPIPVRQVAEQKLAEAEYRSHDTYFTVGATDLITIQRILPQNRNRHRAIVDASPTGLSVEYVVIGTEVQVKAGLGFRLWNGKTIVLESQKELWVGPGTNPPTHTFSVGVIDERYGDGIEE